MLEIPPSVLFVRRIKPASLILASRTLCNPCSSPHSILTACPWYYYPHKSVGILGHTLSLHFHDSAQKFAKLLHFFSVVPPCPHNSTHSSKSFFFENILNNSQSSGMWASRNEPVASIHYFLLDYSQSGGRLASYGCSSPAGNVGS